MFLLSLGAALGVVAWEEKEEKEEVFFLHIKRGERMVCDLLHKCVRDDAHMRTYELCGKNQCMPVKITAAKSKRGGIVVVLFRIREKKGRLFF